MDIARAVIEMATAIILSRSATKSSAKEKPVIIVAGNIELALPASEEKRKQFIAKLSGKNSSRSEVNTKQAKKKSDKRTRPRK
jgi:hypothetical protein